MIEIAVYRSNQTLNLISEQFQEMYENFSFETIAKPCKEMYKQFSSQEKKLIRDCTIKSLALVIFATMTSSCMTPIVAIALGAGSGLAKYALSNLMKETLLTEFVAGYISFEVVTCACLTLGIFNGTFLSDPDGWASNLEAFEVVTSLMVIALMKKVSIQN